jgi:predicted MPP superfamily phosphohydrolase
MTMQTVAWIVHLSDLHFTKVQTEADSDEHANALAAALRTEFVSLPTLGAQKSTCPIAVVISGDLIYQGYDNFPAYRTNVLPFLKKLQESLGQIQPQSFLLVPGNHDVDRAWECLSTQVGDYTDRSSTSWNHGRTKDAWGRDIEVRQNQELRSQRFVCFNELIRSFKNTPADRFDKADSSLLYDLVHLPPDILILGL